jgi:hypothetical protein
MIPVLIYELKENLEVRVWITLAGRGQACRQHRPGRLARIESSAVKVRVDFDTRILFTYPTMGAVIDAPVLILISGELEDCCRAAQNLMLSAPARGLGTCWVGSPLLWLRTEEVKAELQVPTALTPNVAMCLGYANAVRRLRNETDRRLFGSRGQGLHWHAQTAAGDPNPVAARQSDLGFPSPRRRSTAGERGSQSMRIC